MTVPRRLVAIEAAIPTGERCDGCEHYYGGACWDRMLRSSRGEWPLWPENGLRLPACRERDGWVAYGPGSPAPALRFRYTNHRGDTRVRTVINAQIRHAVSEWHGPAPVWILQAWDLEKQAVRDFALAGILEFLGE